MLCVCAQDFEKCNGAADSVFTNLAPHDAVVDHNVDSDGVVMRKRSKKRRSTTRLSVINGHLYDAEVMTELINILYKLGNSPVAMTATGQPHDGMRCEQHLL